MAVSLLVTLFISSLCNLATDTNKFYDITHYHDAVLLTRCYTQNILHPYIDSEINHIRQFIEIQLINKGV